MPSLNTLQLFIKSVRRARRFALALMALSYPFAAWPLSDKSWLLVQPLERIEAADAVAQHFARVLPTYLGAGVELHVPTHAKEVEGVRWALQEAPKEKTLILLSALLLTRLQDSGINDLERRVMVPLQLVLEGAWCLVAPSGLTLPNYEALHTLLKGLGRPVRIAMPGNYGTLRLWLKAMEQKTALQWKAQRYTNSEDGLHALDSGEADMVIDRCHDMDRIRKLALADGQKPTMQVLARSGSTAAFSVPRFTDWTLPPMAPGWIAWFVPAGMHPPRQKMLESALHSVMQREDTQRLLTSTGRVPIYRTPQESRERIRQMQREWRELQRWLDGAKEAH